MKDIASEKDVLEKVLNFKEFPSGEDVTTAKYDEMMSSAGSKAERCAEVLAGLRAQLNARVKKS